MPGRVTTAERRQARAFALDFAGTINRGVDAAQQIGWRAMLAALRALRAGNDPQAPVLSELERLYPLLTSAMLLSTLQGVQRGALLLPSPLSLAVSDVYRAAVGTLRRRLALPDRTVKALEEQLSTYALRIVHGTKAAVEKRLERAMARITREGLHVREGVKALREQFARAGIVPGNSFMLEGIYRTQTALAYAAGKVQVEQTPEAQEILWGYKYVTVGDDRVRDSHIALDGVTLPKTDPFWQENYPPNGWACRCQVIPLYEAPRRVVAAPEEAWINGERIEVGADEGFRFNPGVLIDWPGATLQPI